MSVDRRERVLRVLPDGERRAVGRDLLAEGELRAAAVGQHRVGDGVADGDVAPGALGQPDDEVVELLLGRSSTFVSTSV
ncbi:MAG: hypothetical protein U5J98_08005 [Halobacteriales archaeon]|nr:hypothetical protein [Halobacteriales archaeon]